MVKSKKSRLSGLDNPEVLRIIGEIALERLNNLIESEKKEKAMAETESRESEDSHEHYAPTTISPKIKKKKKQITKKKSKAVVVHHQVEVRSEAGESTPEWLLNYMRRVNGSDPKKIINKRLFKTDLSKSHCRLSIPVKQVVERDFLKEEELNVVEEEGNKGIKAVLIDEEMEEWNVELRKWDMNSTSTYVLVDGWTRLFQERGYVAGDQIRLWSFRCDGLLHFALVPPLGDAAQASLSPSGDAGQASLSPSGDAGEVRSSPDEAGKCSDPSGEEGKGSYPTGESGQGRSSP